MNYNGSEQQITPTVANKVGDDTVTLTVEDNAKTEVGSYTAKVTDVSNSNYTLEGASHLTKEWAISYITSNVTITGNRETNDSVWFTGNVVLTPDSGYMISTDKTTWKNMLSDTQEGEHTITYYLKNQVGSITDVMTANVRVDSVAPTGSIVLKENTFASRLNKITFGLFFKENVDVTITAEDETSGIRSVEYQSVEKGASYDENGTWKTGDQFSIKADDKRVIYAKITDKAGNVTIINTDGIVVFTDTHTTSDKATYTKTTKKDIVTKVKPESNVIADIKLLKNGVECENAPEYTVNTDGFLVLKGDSLESCANANGVGSYSVRVTYHALGETYVSGDKVTDSIVALKIEKMQGTVTIDNNISKTYDGKEVEEPVVTKNSSQPAKVEYKNEDDGDSAYTEEKPVNAGTYDVRVSVAANEDYTESVVTKTFTIAPKDITGATVTLGETHTFTGSSLTQEVTSVVIDGLTATVEITGNTAIYAKTHTMTITGTGNFTGTIEKDYEILPKADAQETGEVTVEVKKDETAPEMKLNMTEEDVAESVLTPEETQQVSNGEKIAIWLEVKDAESTVSQEVKEVIEKKAADYQIGMYVDITLLKQATTQTEPTKITDTVKKIKISVILDEKLLNTNEDMTRTYAVVRNHDNQADLLDAVFDEKTKTLTFETDKFSDYAIVYKDGKKVVVEDVTYTGLDLKTSFPTVETMYKAGDGTITVTPADDKNPATVVMDNATIKKSILTDGMAVMFPSEEDLNIHLIIKGTVSVEDCMNGIGDMRASYEHTNIQITGEKKSKLLKLRT